MIISSIMSKVLGGLSAALAITCFIFYSMWQGAVTDNITLRNNVESLQRLNVNQQQSIQDLREDKTRLNQNINTLTKSNQETFAALSEELKELNRLRVQEARKAYEQPFQSGTAYTNDVYNRMLNIVGRKEDRSPD